MILRTGPLLLLLTAGLALAPAARAEEPAAAPTAAEAKPEELPFLAKEFESARS